MLNRRELLGLGVRMAVGTSAGALLVADALAGTKSVYTPAFALLDRYVEQYLREMNAPGLTLSLADASGVQRVTAYGLEQLSPPVALNPGKLFHIGSITKSLLGLCLVQLQEEGKVDLHRPVLDYLPTLRLDGLTRPLTAHDLLTHSAALPDGELFPADPAFRYRSTAEPGTFFHYCNMAFDALGHLVAKLDGRSLAESFRARIFEPLGMTSSDPAIMLDGFARVAASYRPVFNDRPFPRDGALLASPPIETSAAAGCIASTARDMGAYVTMLINRGATRKGRIVTEAGFELFASPHMSAEHFGPGASYGYGIAVDQLDGHTRLRHTGGMVSFASALEVDRDTGIGVFASINAMQGFRPRPVAEYALRLMRACREGKPLLETPPSKSRWSIESASDYAGRYTSASGRALDVVAEGDRVYLVHRGVRVPLEPSPDFENAFLVHHADFASFALVFGRAGADGKGRVVEAGWGDEWFTTSSYDGPRSFDTPDAWRPYVGYYRTEDPWLGGHRISLRRGRLWLDGVIPLEAAPDGRFYWRDEPQSPEWVRFSDIVDTRAMRMTLSGYELRRV